MARVKGAMMTRKRRNKTLKIAKGYWGSKSKHFKMAKEAVMKSGNYAYPWPSRRRSRDFRKLWISRISAAVAPVRDQLLPLHERPQKGWHHHEPEDALRAGNQ